jgi:hypothetical protein
MLTVAYCLLTLWLLWVFYLAVMTLWRAKEAGTISRVALVPGYLTLGVGVLLDVLANILLMSFIFLELPRQWLVTQRLKHHNLNGRGWRQRLARWICKHLLDAFDPTGCHCD